MMGFTDARLAKLTGRDEGQVRRARQRLGVTAVFKRIDTCAAEFEAQTPYMYSTYEAPAMGEVEDEARPLDAKKVVILGGGPNRIGQGIEFDYCCCHACFALSKAGYETIMVNCNPETVSTDYDTSDRLYFEPVTFEHVMEILRVEQSNGTLHGVIVQFGGQTPLKLAMALTRRASPSSAPPPTPSTSPRTASASRARGQARPQAAPQRHRLLARAGLRIAREIGFPLVIRPSYVLGGRAMEIVRDDAQLSATSARPSRSQGTSPVLLDSYLSGATEVDVDALCDGTRVHVAGIMQHIEEAGVHSGDSACCLPPPHPAPETIATIREQTEALALALRVVGLMNVQFAVKDGDVYLSRSTRAPPAPCPFVAKATDSAIASIAARLMAGETLDAFPLRPPYPNASYDTPLPYADPMTLADPAMPWFSVKEACSPSPASPAWTRSWAPRCAPRARSWAGTAASPAPSSRRRWARA
jgi:carbamoyl-phosphate synthase large subunit